MALQDGLDLRRGDVLAAADDRVVRPPVDEQVAVLVQVADVAGREPAPVVESGGGAGVLAGDLISSHPDLSASCGSASPSGPVPTGAAPDLDLDSRQHPTGGAETGPGPGSVDSNAARWSAGPRTAIVELVSVRP